MLFVKTVPYKKYFSPKILLEAKQSLYISLPLIASNLTNSFSSFLATTMVAHLGEYQLAANALVWSIYIVVILFFTGILSAISIVVSQNHGAKDLNKISVCFKQGLILAIIFVVPMSIIMRLSPVVLIYAGQEPKLIHVATPFFQSLIWTMLPLNLLLLLQQFCIGTSNTKVVMCMSLIQVPIEILFYYMFLFGKLGVPAFGLAGIGYAIALTYSVIIMGFGCYLYFSIKFRGYQLFNGWWQVSKKNLLELFNMGIPLGLLYCTDVMFFAVIAFMMGILGTINLAAYQIAYQYLMIALSVIFALTQAITVRIGYKIGNKSFKELRLTAIVNIIISLIIVSFFSISYICLSELAVSIDLDIYSGKLQLLVEKAKKFLSLVGILIIGECIRIGSLGVLRGLKDTRSPLLASIVGLWCIALPCSYILSFKFHFGGSGVLYGFIVGVFTAGIILLIRVNNKLEPVPNKFSQ